MRSDTLYLVILPWFISISSAHVQTRLDVEVSADAGFWGGTISGHAHDKTEEDPSIPVNSAGEHFGRQKTIDIILLFVVLCIPFVIYCIQNKYDQMNKAMPCIALEGRSPATAARMQKESLKEPSYKWPEDTKFSNLTRTIQPARQNSNEQQVQEQKQTPSEGTILQNVLAGFSTSMAALPDAISFSFITGVSPLNGIWAGVIMGLTCALCGGRPGMISSASAATAVVLAMISTDPNLGMGPMALCVFIVGILQIIAAALRLSRFITLIPHSVMLGFVNGLAIVMVRAQMRQFHHHGDGPMVEKSVCLSMIITALVAMAVAVIWSRVPYVGKILPAPLASVILTAVFSIAIGDFLPRRTLRDVAGSHTFRGGFNTMPSWDFPPMGVNWHDHEMFFKVISVAVRFAIVGLLESLMTESLIDQITGTSSSMRRECFGQGLGNILSSLFGLQGGCALIAQSLMNVGSGGQSRVSGITMAISLGGCVVCLAPLMAEIPVAALVGLITLIACNTFAWGSLKLVVQTRNFVDSVVVVLVTVITVWKDLAVAVVIGVIISGVGFAWSFATEVKLESYVEDGARVYMLRGPLFFGSAMNYRAQVCSGVIGEKKVILDLSHSKILDVSGSDAIAKTVEFLKEQGKNVVLRGVGADAVKELPSDLQYEDLVEPPLSYRKGSPCGEEEHTKDGGERLAAATAV